MSIDDKIHTEFLEFFKSKGHAVIPGANLVPENDPTALFISAGMQPLVPYLLGEIHPLGRRLCNFQKCVRTDDIEEVGDRSHLTFFEMAGNWSLGDYFKKEAIEWSFEFLTHFLEFDPKRLYVTVFKGDDVIERDLESVAIWQERFSSAGIVADVNENPGESDFLGRISTYGRKKNFWGPVGKAGPCGPTTEMFYDTGVVHDPKFGPYCHPNCDCGRFIEIWNDVFMFYIMKETGVLEQSMQRNVDTGMGFTRVCMIHQFKNAEGAVSKEVGFASLSTFRPLLEGLASVLDINISNVSLDQSLELFLSAKIADKFSITVEEALRLIRIIVDHIRASIFIIGDGVVLSNKEQGYMLRRLIRRAVWCLWKLGVKNASLESFVSKLIHDSYYQKWYPELLEKEAHIAEVINTEMKKFSVLLEKGLKELSKIDHFDGKKAFNLYETFGFPKEMIMEIAKEKGQNVDEAEFTKEFEEHQALSRTGAQKKFSGGLADGSVENIRYHTVTHLLLAALKEILGPTIKQMGSNITSERLRLDFPYDKLLTSEQISKVEKWVNDAISKDLSVSYELLSKEVAKQKGAECTFWDRYPEMVKVYTIKEDATGKVYSYEVCGGPHVSNTSEIRVAGKFKIIKEESSSAGIRRIKAVLS